MNFIKTILLIMILSTFFIVDNTFWAWWIENINSWLIWDENNADLTIQSYIKIIISFLYLVAVVYWIYWWFQILTAWDDEDKVKSWKTIIIQSLIWIVIIFLAWPIVNLFLWAWSTDWILTK